MLLKNGQKKERRSYIFEEKKTEKNQNNITIMIFIVGKGTVFPVKLKLEDTFFV